MPTIVSISGPKQEQQLTIFVHPGDIYALSTSPDRGVNESSCIHVPYVHGKLKLSER